MKKAAFLALTLIGLSQAATAQVIIQTPAIPGVTVQQPYRGDYWRSPREERGEAEWRRRAEYREREHSQRDWVRAHCVRDWQGHEYCRR